VVTEEFARASEDLGRRLSGLLSEFEPVFLDFDEDAFALFNEYLQFGVVPPSKEDDARHVAVAVANELDFLYAVTKMANWCR
jgi:hypothetical protein